MGVKSKYTAKQIKYIKELREEGFSWKRVADMYNSEYGEEKDHDALRKAIGSSVKPQNKIDKATVIRRKDAAERKHVDTREQYECVLVIPDLHVPFHHPEAFDFLRLVKETYEPDKIINIGDEADKHAMSFHDSDPDLPSAGDELSEAIGYLEELYEIFPEVALVDSNHGSMHYRKGKHHGIPRKYLKEYGDILEAPKGWTWDHELNLNCGGNMVRFKHQHGKNILKSAEQAACCLVGGHFHEDFLVQYSGNSDRLIWAVTSGCLVDDSSLAFAYNNSNMKRPILGCTVIVNGHPILVPMLLERGGRWKRWIP